MRKLQDLIEKTVDELPQEFLSHLLEEKIKAEGIRLSHRERKLLLKYVRRGIHTFRIRGWRFWDRKSVSIELTSQDAAGLEKSLQDFAESQLPRVLDAMISTLSPKIEASIKRNWTKESRLQQKDLDKFTRNLRKRWGKGLELLRLLAAMSRELGSSVRQEVSAGASAPDHKHLFDVLFRLHARACQTTEEIICLLESGFADGAMARWRSLHEIAVVALFISGHGEELAERYALHEVVESRRAAAEYEEHRERLGYEALDPADIKAMEDSCAALGKRFGADFLNPFGWASAHIKNPKPKFVDIQRAAGLEHFKAHFRMASHGVHANPTGIFFKLGILGDSEVLLAGPSNAGLADPGHAAAVSLSQVTSTIGTLDSTFDNLITLKIVAQLVDQVGDAFMEAHDRLKSDEAKLRTK